MSDENTPDQISQSGGVTANVGGDLSAGQDIVGRDSIVSTTNTTTNVFISDRLATRSLVVLLGVVILGLLGFVVVAVSQLVPAPSVETLRPSILSETLGSPVTAKPGDTLSSTSVPTTLPPSATSLPLPVQLPDGYTVAIIIRGQETIQYTVLSAQREPLPPGRYLLQLRVRAWTDSSNGASFWSDSFRLVVGDQRLAPVNYLNEMVNRDETVDGDVVFEIADSLTDAVLEIQSHYDSETKQLRLTFP